jgi:hypothetical protein
MEPTVAHATAAMPLDGREMRLGDKAAPLITTGLAIGIAGLAIGCYLGFTAGESRRLFFHAYLTAFSFFLSITLGALFFVMLQHLSRAGWSVAVRRMAEGLSGNIGLMLLLFVPVLIGMSDIYEWTHAPAPEHGAATADPDVFPTKAQYLTPRAYLLRFVVYFAIWGLLVLLLRSRSIRQDATGDPRLTASMERISAPGMIAFSFTVLFASIDLLMSQNPHWYSTIFGLYFFAGCVLAGMAALTLLTLYLRCRGHLGSAVSVEHLHDLGKFTFGFVFFWGYIAFSQYMLIWYANLPEETQFYMLRQIGPWIGVSAALLLCQFLIPFLGLMSRHAKRRPAVLAFWCVWILAAHLLDMFWLVMPNLYMQEMPHAVGEASGTPLPEVLKEMLASNQAVYQLAEHHEGFMRQVWLPLEGRSIIMLLALVAGMAGLYLANTAWQLRRAALVPVADPRLHESLAFENV